MAGCGGGAYCLRSCPAVPKIDEPGLVDKQREMGSVEEDGVISVGRVMTRLKPENPVA